MTPEEKKRRKFMQQISGLGVLGLVAAAGIVGGPYLKPKELRLRPPGAVDEEEFLGYGIYRAARSGMLSVRSVSMYSGLSERCPRP